MNVRLEPVRPHTDRMNSFEFMAKIAKIVNPKRKSQVIRRQARKMN